MRNATPSAIVLAGAILGLCACNTPDALNPAAIQPLQPVPALAAGEAVEAEAAGAPQASASALLPAPAPAALSPAPVGGVRLQFAPVVGATVDAATPMSRRLSIRAAERGLAVVGGDNSPTLLMKGYFSAISEGKQTIVIFVWDVVGPDGNRLHRIQGQERVAGTAAEAWSAVPGRTMETIADRTIDELTLWLSTRQG